MDISIDYRPAHSLATVELADGESVVAEAGAMVGMSGNIRIETRTGGVKKGLGRILGGESFFRTPSPPRLMTRPATAAGLR